MNSGGAHCLKYGVTTNNVLGLRMVLMDGEIVEIGGPYLDAEGYDFLALIVGSEGQFGIVTEATVRILPKAARARARCCSASIRARRPASASPPSSRSGIIPVAIEFMDKPAIAVCEAFAKAGYPLDVEALLIVEVEGSRGRDRPACSRDIVEIAKSFHPKVVEASTSAEHSARIWKGRKAAFGAIGRISDYYCMDGTIPLARLPEVLGADHADLRRAWPQGGQRVPCRRRQPAPAHPLQCQQRGRGAAGRARRRGDPEAVRRGRRLPHRRARRRHREARPDGRAVLAPPTSPCRCASRACSIPHWLLNPGKVFPLDGARDRPSVAVDGQSGLRRRIALSDLQRPGADWELQFMIAGCAEKRVPIEIVGAGSKRAVGRPVDGAVTITTASLRGITLYEPSELVMSARAGTPLSQIEAELAARGQMLAFEPIDLGAGDRRPAGHADHRRRVRHQPVGRAAHPMRRGARSPARRQGRQRPRRAVPVRRPRDEERDRLRRRARARRAAGARSR